MSGMGGYQCILENVDKIESLEIRGEVEKYTYIQLDIIEDIMKNIENFFVDIQ